MIIIPTYNEKQNIPQLVSRIRTVLGDIGILFVDDSSPDGTADAIRELQQNDPGISLILRPAKMGLGSAYLHAFDYLFKHTDAKYVVTLDADLSHEPEALPEIFARLKNYPMVVGSRYTTGGKIRNWNFFRRFVSRAGNIYARIFTGVPISDLTSGFVGYRADWLRQLDFSQISSEGYAFQIEMKCLLHGLGAEVFEHPITFTERKGGRSKFSLPIVAEGAVYPLKTFIKNLRK
ncbi:MAG: polyprenol monophosphomannose synthase [bacterium]|nr:polyprenol monophosphomannose synthase [bacterium]